MSVKPNCGNSFPVPFLCTYTYNPKNSSGYMFLVYFQEYRQHESACIYCNSQKKWSRYLKIYVVKCARGRQVYFFMTNGTVNQNIIRSCTQNIKYMFVHFWILERAQPNRGTLWYDSLQTTIALRGRTRVTKGKPREKTTSLWWIR